MQALRSMDLEHGAFPRYRPSLALASDEVDALAARRAFDAAIAAAAVNAQCVPLQSHIERDASRSRARLDWAEHNSRLTDFEFRRLYRMRRETFQSLCNLVRPRLVRNTEMGRRGSSGGTVSVEAKLSMALRFMAGGSYLDIALYHGVHRSTFFEAVWDVVGAVNEAITLTLPVDDKEALQVISDGFQKRMNNPLSGCIGAMDGIAIAITRPTNCVDSQSYFNRKGFFALPLQALCDHQYKFTAASCMCTGSTHDAVCFAVSGLGRYIEQHGLPGEFWIAADEAYPASDRILTPWPGRQLPANKDSFNFWLSSSRIHIEQAFGILVARWGVLWRPLRVDFRDAPSLIMALLKLHNWCIDHGDMPTRRDPSDERLGDIVSLNLQDECADRDQGRGRRRDLEGSRRRALMTDRLDALGILRPVRPGRPNE
jgi:hypothetical protein